MDKIIFIGDKAFAGRLAEEIEDGVFIPFEKRKFADGEICPRLLLNSIDILENSHIILVPHLNLQVETINDYLISFLYIINTIKEFKPKRTSVVFPYHIYARQDKVFRPGEVHSVKILADLIESADVDDFITFTTHMDRNGEINTLFINSAPFNLSGFISLGNYLKKELSNPEEVAFIAPDGKALPWAKEMAQILGSYLFTVLQKKRDLNTGEILSQEFEDDLDVKDKIVVLVDDIVASGGSMVGAANILKSFGARDVIFAYVHAIHGQDSFDRLQSVNPLMIITTNSVNNNIEGLVTVDLVPQLLDFIKTKLIEDL